MHNMYEIISELCRKRAITPSAMCRELGISKSLMTELKMGRSKQLSMSNAEKVATYFDVTTDYLLGKTDTKKPAPQEDELIKDEFIAFYGEVKQDLDEDDIADLKTFIRMKSEIKRKLAEKK